MRRYDLIALLVLVLALGVGSAACHRKPVESLAPTPVQLPTEPAKPDPMEQGRGSDDSGAMTPAYAEPGEGREAEIQTSREENAPTASAVQTEEATPKEERAVKVVKPRPPATQASSSLQKPSAAKKHATLEPAERRVGHTGRPRVMVLINRKFAGSVDEWESDSRILITESSEEATQEGSSVTTTEGANTKTAAVQTRTGGERGTGLSEDALWAVEDYFVTPFRAAGYPVVDPDVATRLAAGASAGSGELLKAGRDAQEIDADGVRRNADWMVELLITPSTTNEDDWVLSAKAIDLESSRVLAFVTSQSLPRKPHFPGAPQTRKAKPLNQMAGELASALMVQLPR